MNTPIEILRKRLIIELRASSEVVPFEKGFLETFLNKLSEIADMTIIHGPNVHDWAKEYKPEQYDGYEGYVIWAESGTQVYTWDRYQFATIDMYTCKDFDIGKIVEFVRTYFQATELAFHEVEPLLGVTGNLVENHPSVEIRETGTEKGKGLFAKNSIPAETVVTTWNGTIYESISESQLPLEASLTAIPFGEIHYRDGASRNFGRYVNHSCDANCYITNHFQLRTIRDIQEGEELTLNYATTCDSDWEAPEGICMCGSDNCHGTILPWRELPQDEKSRLLPYVADWILLKEMKERGYVEHIHKDLQNSKITQDLS